jgi:hypothetical protein
MNFSYFRSGCYRQNLAYEQLLPVFTNAGRCLTATDVDLRATNRLSSVQHFPNAQLEIKYGPGRGWFLPSSTADSVHHSAPHAHVCARASQQKQDDPTRISTPLIQQVY